MNKFGKKRLALALACASVFAGKTSAANINKSQAESPQILGAVRGAASRIKIAKNKKGLPVWAKALIFVGGAGVVAEMYSEIVALAMGEKPKTLLTGKYSITELIRSMNKKKKPGEQQQYKHEKNPEEHDPKGKTNEHAPKQGYAKAPYFDENNQKFVDKFTSDKYPNFLAGFQKFQKQVLELGVDGIIANSVIEDQGIAGGEVPKDDETMKKILKIACEVISGRVPILKISDIDNFESTVTSSAGVFRIYPLFTKAGVVLRDDIGKRAFSFVNITGN